MVKKLSHFNKRIRNQILYLALILAIPLFINGCMVGYRTYKTERWEPTQPTENIPSIKVSYGVTVDSSAYDFYMPILLFSFERTLRERFHILDVQLIPETDLNNDPERFNIRIHVSATEPPVENIWGMISGFSFSVIPGSMSETYTLEYTIIAPGGDAKTFQYHYTKRGYSWLPFMLFGPQYLGTPGGTVDYSAPREIKVLDGITTHFMTEATPFILSHTAQPAS